jgi:hypothetical protein
MSPFRRLRACLLWVLLLALLLAPAAWAGGQSLASWREPLRGQLIAFAAAAADPASPGYVPQDQRIAAFDVDGTLMVERPLFFVAEVAKDRLQAICPAYGRQGPVQAAQCRAAAEGDDRYLLAHLDSVLSQPFAGMTQAAYRQLAARVWAKQLNPKLRRPPAALAYLPMRELIDLLKQKGFTVYLNSGMDALAMMAISSTWGLGPERCLGTNYELRAREQEGRVGFIRTGRLLPENLNLRQNKAIALLMRTGRRPILAAGNSGGDAWMLRMAAESKPSLALLVNHDDPREFVYGKPKLLKEAARRGWRVISMRRDWTRLFGPEK